MKKHILIATIPVVRSRGNKRNIPAGVVIETDVLQPSMKVLAMASLDFLPLHLD